MTDETSGAVSGAGPGAGGEGAAGMSDATGPGRTVHLPKHVQYQGFTQAKCSCGWQMEVPAWTDAPELYRRHVLAEDECAARWEAEQQASARRKEARLRVVNK